VTVRGRRAAYSERVQPPLTAPLGFASDEQRLRSFASSLDAIRSEVEADLGARDVEHIRSIGRLSTRLEWVGRGLLQLSFEPVGFGLGVSALCVHKTLELMEIGHTVLHGAYDALPGAEAYRAEGFHWKAPIDEDSWCSAHNVRHHQYTNVAERDPDLDFRGLRLSALIPHRLVHRLQPLTNLGTWTAFAAAINLHASGVLESYSKGPQYGLPDRSWRTIREAHRRAFRKYVPYYAREFIFFPLLAGPFFWKPLLGNILSEVGRDVYAAATIYCGHVGAAEYPSGTRAGGRARWYVMQVEAAQNFEIPHALSVLCGALNFQIEHHLFPRLPPNRLRDIAPRVRAVCEAHGVRYQTAGWGRTLRSVLGRLRELASPAASLEARAA
jgi:fatty acid desaturase